jgi:hypothetical protein
MTSENKPLRVEASWWSGGYQRPDHGLEAAEVGYEVYWWRKTRTWVDA